MKIKVWCDSGANAFSQRTEIIDLYDWGIGEQEWSEMSEDAKEALVEEWAYDKLEIGFEEV